MHTGIRNQSEKLVNKFWNAILNDDIGMVSSFLKEDFSLVHQTIKRDIFIKSIPHWLYKGDNLLHLCAAGLCLESAKLLLKHGVDVNALNRRKATPLHY